MRQKSLERIIEQHFKEEETRCKTLNAILWTAGYVSAQPTRRIRKSSGYTLQPHGGLVFIDYEPNTSIEERDKALCMLKKYQVALSLKGFHFDLFEEDPPYLCG